MEDERLMIEDGRANQTRAMFSVRILQQRDAQGAKKRNTRRTGRELVVQDLFFFTRL